MSDLKKIYHKLHLMLRYEEGGNYTKLSDILSRSNLLSQDSDRYLAYNLIQSFWISGIINISWESSGMRWCYVPGDLMIPISTNKVKKVIKEEELLKTDKCENTVIQDSTGLPLVFTETLKSEENASLWCTSFFDRFTPFSILVDKSLEKKETIFLSGKQVSRFDFNNKEWQEYSTMDFSVPGLLKVQNERFGFSYYIYEAVSSTLFRVVEVEWMFIFSMFMLNIPFEKVFTSTNSNIEHAAQIRIPTMLARYLFANADQVKIGHHIRYVNIKPETISSLKRYLVLEHSL